MLLAIFSTSLFATTTNEITVMRISAYISANTLFTTHDDFFVIESNSYNFSYAVHENNRTKRLLVLAI